MTESYSDLQQIFQNHTKTKVFTCYDSLNEKSHEIDKRDVVLFYKYYCDTYFSKDFANWDELPILGISEKVEKNIPVIGDFILRYSTEPNDIYSTTCINEIIKIYQETIKRKFELSDNHSETTCVYLKSKSWYEDGNTCTRLRFHFPYCRVKKDVVNSVINPIIVNMLNNSFVTSSFNKNIKGGWSESLKDIGNYVPLYGSTDKPKQIPPLMFVGVFGEEDINGVCLQLELENTFNHEKHSFLVKDKCEIDDAEIINEDCDIEDDYAFSCYTLPMFLSIYFHTSTCQLKDDEIHSETSSVIIEEDDDVIEDIKTELDLCNELVKYLTPKRFNVKSYFLDIGRAYYNATEGSYKGLFEWSKVASKSKVFDKNFCDQHYDSFENDKVTVRTLGWYFRTDNRKKYDNWHRNWCYSTLYDSRESEHTVVGEAFYKCFWTRYMYTGKMWYEFRRNRLVGIEEQKIEKTITNEFIPCFDNLSYQLQGEIQKLNTRMKIGSKTHQSAVGKLQEEIQKIQKLIQRLRNIPFRGCILKSIRTFFYYENIHKVLDKNPDILGCSNCVIELTEEKAIKRDGKPEDFITKKIGVPYMTNYSFDHPDVKDIIKYLTQVFPVKEIREYMYKDLASMLYRRNSEKLFRVWIGDTNGSKSILQKMMRRWLGDYYCDVPQEVYSGKKFGSSGPSPEMAQLDNAAVGFTAEPDDSEPLKGAKIKGLTGGDSFFARGCGVDGGSIETTLKMIMVLNVVPDITGMDEATKNRFMMIPFEGRWLKSEEEDKTPIAETFEEQVRNKTYRMDPRFEEHIPRLASALNWLCIQNYGKYLREGLKRPSYIRKFMEEYWSKNDPFSAFIDENLEIPKKEDGLVDDKKYITATDIYPLYRSWFKQNYPKFSAVEKRKFTPFMCAPDRLGKQKGRRWYGYTIRDTQKE